jgi:hypothetical protein
MCAYKFRAGDWKDGRKYTIFKIILMYSTIFSTESPASGAGEISKHRLMKQIGRLRVDQVCFCSVFCLRSNCSHVTDVGEP